MKHIWLWISKHDLEIEKKQLLEEGKDFLKVEKEYNALMKLNIDDNMKLQPRVEAFLDKTIKLPLVKGYKFNEPSDLKTIKKLRPKGVRKFKKAHNDKVLLDKVLGAWLGRCSGCLLGKPVEGWRTPKMWGYLKDLNKYPLADYFHSDLPEKFRKKYELDKGWGWINKVKHMVEDDDTNYTVTGFVVMKNKGKKFTPENVADFWLANIPITHTCTAERVAYKNFCLLIMPPASASFRNVYREWIGAQIRADFFGYAAMGNPELAAEFAWRDASISHVKNGIYGEMWAAAMIAAAPYLNSPLEVINAGLSEIPKDCRLAEDVRSVISWYLSGLSYDEAVKRIHLKWNENLSHDWCHTISNAMIVALGLLYGELDFEKSICKAVQACFDTDCNGATVGSIVGMMLGAKKLPAKWIKPLNNELETGIAGYNLVKIDDLAKQGFKIYKDNSR